MKFEQFRCAVVLLLIFLTAAASASGTAVEETKRLTRSSRLSSSSSSRFLQLQTRAKVREPVTIAIIVCSIIGAALSGSAKGVEHHKDVADYDNASAMMSSINTLFHRMDETAFVVKTLSSILENLGRKFNIQPPLSSVSSTDSQLEDLKKVTMAATSGTLTNVLKERGENVAVSMSGIVSATAEHGATEAGVEVGKIIAKEVAGHAGAAVVGTVAAGAGVVLGGVSLFSALNRDVKDFNDKTTLEQIESTKRKIADAECDVIRGLIDFSDAAAKQITTVANVDEANIVACYLTLHNRFSSWWSCRCSYTERSSTACPVGWSTTECRSPPSSSKACSFDALSITTAGSVDAVKKSKAVVSLLPKDSIWLKENVVLLPNVVGVKLLLREVYCEDESNEPGRDEVELFFGSVKNALGLFSTGDRRKFNIDLTSQEKGGYLPLGLSKTLNAKEIDTFSDDDMGKIDVSFDFGTALKLTTAKPFESSVTSKAEETMINLDFHTTNEGKYHFNIAVQPVFSSTSDSSTRQ